MGASLPSDRPLGPLAELRAEQTGIGGPRPLQRFGIGDEVDQGVAIADGLLVTQLGSLNAEAFGLTVDAFSRGPLPVESLVEGGSAVERHTHLGALFAVEVFDTARAFEKLLVVTGLASGLRKEQGTLKTLGAVAIGVLEALGGHHPTSCATRLEKEGGKKHRNVSP